MDGSDSRFFLDDNDNPAEAVVSVMQLFTHDCTDASPL
jgi:hypothetical protein